MKNKTFSVLGCGWLGMPLAQSFEKEGYTVKGSTTTVAKCEEMLEYNIQPYLLSIDEEIEGNLESFLQTDTLFINIPFRKQKAFLKTYQELVSAIEKSSVQNVIFVSSTSVYQDVNGEITEEDVPNNPAKKELIELEKLFANNQKFNSTIIRFSGLIGGTRNPGNFFKEGRVVKNALAPVNLIHLEDCIGVVKAIVQQNRWNTTYNVSATTHPSKVHYYKKATLNMGKKTAAFVEELDRFKIINNQKVLSELQYEFQFPDLLESLSEFEQPK